MAPLPSRSNLKSCPSPIRPFLSSPRCLAIRAHYSGALAGLSWPRRLSATACSPLEISQAAMTGSRQKLKHVLWGEPPATVEERTLLMKIDWWAGPLDCSSAGA